MDSVALQAGPAEMAWDAICWRKPCEGLRRIPSEWQAKLPDEKWLALLAREVLLHGLCTCITAAEVAPSRQISRGTWQVVCLGHCCSGLNDCSKDFFASRPHQV